MSSPMQTIVKGHIYWAGEGFTHRGLWLWIFERNIRIIPTNRFLSWTGGQADRRCR